MLTVQSASQRHFRQTFRPLHLRAPSVPPRRDYEGHSVCSNQLPKPPIPEVLKEASSDVFRRDSAELNDRLTRRERQLRIVGNSPIGVFAKGNSPRLALKRTTHRITDRPSEQTPSNPIL